MECVVDIRFVLCSSHCRCVQSSFYTSKYSSQAGSVRWMSQQYGSAALLPALACNSQIGSPKKQSKLPYFIAFKCPRAFSPLSVHHMWEKRTESQVPWFLNLVCPSPPENPPHASDCNFWSCGSTVAAASRCINLCHSETKWPKVFCNPLSGSPEIPLFDSHGSSSHRFSRRNCGSWLIVRLCELESFHSDLFWLAK